MAFPGTVPVRVGHFAKTLPYPVSLHLPPFGQPDRRPARTIGSDLNIIVPHDDERHTKLGTFMNSWSLLESTLEFLLEKLLGIELPEARLTFAKLSTRNAIDLLNGLGIRKLIEVDSMNLMHLTERLSELNAEAQCACSWSMD